MELFDHTKKVQQSRIELNAVLDEKLPQLANNKFQLTIKTPIPNNKNFMEYDLGEID